MPKPEPPKPSRVLRQYFQHQGVKFRFVSQRLRFPNQTEGDREYIVHPGGAVAVPITEDGRFVLLEQYRFAVGDYIYEFPAGTLEPNEEPLITAQRELAEEAGYTAAQWDDLGRFYLAPGYSDEMLYLYLARGLEVLPEPPAGDDDEDIKLVYFSTAEFLELAARSSLTERPCMDVKTLACFQRAQQVLG